MDRISRNGSVAYRGSEPDGETETTESCSDEEGATNPQHGSAINRLAVALMAWHPGLIGPEVLECASHPAACAFADFLTQLEGEARPRLALRREVIGWLQGFQGSKDRLQRLLDAVGRDAGTTPAMTLYPLLRDSI